MTRTIDVRNPRNGETDYQVTQASAQDVQQLSQRLRANQQAWFQSGIDHRIRVLRAWRDALAELATPITAALTQDTGRAFASGFELQLVMARIDHWCEQAPALLEENAPGTSSSLPSVRYRHQRIPYPLVGVISPWNFPLTLAMIDAIPALVAGCAVLLKPSEITPRFAEPIRESLQRVPELAGVFDLVIGGAETGQAMTDACDAVCFTGSVATGRKVAMQAAASFIPAFLELGGKDPAIVLASADLDNAVRAVIRSAIGSTGQACMSLERVFVERSIYSEFLQRLTAAAEKVRLNYPDIHDGHIGPLIFEGQARTIERQLEDAVAGGATVHCGGKVEQLGGGLWCRPTVLSNVRDDMLVMTEETFGPLIPVLPFDTTSEAIERANAGDFGLSAAVFAGTIEEAAEVATQLDAGAVNINDASLTAMVHDVEKNSFRLSGMGASRMGPSGLLRFLRKKALLMQTAPAMDLDIFDERNGAPMREQDQNTQS